MWARPPPMMPRLPRALPACTASPELTGIVGLSSAWISRGGIRPNRVVVYAVDRLPPDLEGEEESPLTALRLPDAVRMEDFIVKAFQGISIRLMSRLHQGRRRPVVSGDEMPVVTPDEANGAPGETQGSAGGAAV
jgi:hypothetical protein